MTKQQIARNAEQAATELEATAESLEAQLRRIDAVLGFLRTVANRHVGEDLIPQHLRIDVAELWSAHQAAQRVFVRHLSLYPEHREEWVDADINSFRTDSLHVARRVLDGACELLKRCASIARCKASPKSGAKTIYKV